jgi:SET domain-containing protein
MQEREPYTPFRDEDVEVRPSHVHGLGVFAMRAFSSGTWIRTTRILREVTPSHPLQLGENVDHCMYVLDRTYLVGVPDCYVNHSCAPTAHHGFDGTRCSMVSMRDIAADDEITFDYMINTDGGSSWRCTCGAAGCRGRTHSSFFDLPIDLQRRYRSYLASWFVDAHRDKVTAIG